MARKGVLLLQARHLREAEEQAELKDLTFKPEISKLAKALRTQEQEVGGCASAFERLYLRTATAKRQVRAGVGAAHDGVQAPQCGTTGLNGACLFIVPCSPAA